MTSDEANRALARAVDDGFEGCRWNLLAINGKIITVEYARDGERPGGG